MGYMAGITNQLPKNLTHAGVTGSVLHASIFGDWSQMIFADWGAVEVIYDPYTQAGNGAIVLTMRSLHDMRFATLQRSPRLWLSPSRNPPATMSSKTAAPLSTKGGAA